MDLTNGLRRITEPLEALDEEGLDDPELRLEVVVDPHGGDAGGGGDLAYGQALWTLGLQDLGRRREKRLLHPGAGSPGPADFRHIGSVLKNIVL